MKIELSLYNKMPFVVSGNLLELLEPVHKFPVPALIEGRNWNGTAIFLPEIKRAVYAAIPSFLQLVTHAVKPNDSRPVWLNRKKHLISQTNEFRCSEFFWVAITALQNIHSGVNRRIDIDQKAVMCHGVEPLVVSRRQSGQRTSRATFTGHAWPSASYLGVLL